MTDILNKHHPLSPNGVDDEVRNTSGNLGFDAILEARISRRTLLKGSFATAATTLFGSGLAGCNDSDAAAPAAAAAVFGLGFTAVAKSLADVVSVPAGYSVSVLYRLGDPINGQRRRLHERRLRRCRQLRQPRRRPPRRHALFRSEQRWHRRDYNNAKRGLLAINHENITQIFLHTPAEVAAGFPTAGRVPAQIDKEVNVHGVSVIEVVRDGGPFQVNKGSTFNRRITAASLMDISGPVRGDDLLVTRFSPAAPRRAAP